MWRYYICLWMSSRDSIYVHTYFLYCSPFYWTRKQRNKILIFPPSKVTFTMLWYSLQNIQNPPTSISLFSDFLKCPSPKEIEFVYRQQYSWLLVGCSCTLLLYKFKEIWYNSRIISKGKEIYACNKFCFSFSDKSFFFRNNK